MEYIRDYCMYAAIFGFFGFVWFGWAQEKPRPNWRVFLGIASGVSFLISLAGVYLSIKNWNAPSALSDSDAFRMYLIFFYLELIVAGAGAFVLIRKKRNPFVAPWIALIVGIHFIGLAPVFKDPALYILAALLIVVPVVAIFVSPRLYVAYSAVTGTGAGTVLLGFAVLGLIRYWLAQG